MFMMYVRPRNTRTEMNAGRVGVACCCLVSHIEYTPRALFRLEKRRDRQTDRRTDAANVITTFLHGEGCVASSNNTVIIISSICLCAKNRHLGGGKAETGISYIATKASATPRRETS